jgi:hypothetical protein
MYRSRASLVLSMAFMGACTGMEPTPEIISIAPNQGYSDRDLNLTLTGRSFIPNSTLDPRLGYHQKFMNTFHGRVGQNGLWVNLVDFTWHSTTELKAKLMRDALQDLPKGVYDVEITDPRGTTALLPQALTLYGHDTLAPEISLSAPLTTAVITAGMEIHTSVLATDPAPGLIHQIQWRYSVSGIPQRDEQCTTTSLTAQLSCPIDFNVAPELLPGTEITLEVWAFDTALAPNLGSLIRTFNITPPPSLIALTPSYGAASGGTELLVKGNDFFPGCRAYLDGNLLIPEGGIWVDNQTLTGHAPPHAEGSVDLLLEGPFGQSLIKNAFYYYPAPKVLRVIPEQGAPGTPVVITGENFTNRTQISFGTVLQTSVPLEQPVVQNSTTILGFAPFHIGKTIVWAFDPKLGFSKLLNGYTFVSE